MTVSKVVEREELAQTLEDWLVASDIPLTMPLELFFLFVDGNKRTALSACFWFLESNGYTLDVGNEDLYQFTIDVASGRLDKDAVTAWAREHLRPLKASR